MKKTKQEIIDFLEEKYLEEDDEFHKGILLTLVYIGKHSQEG